VRSFALQSFRRVRGLFSLALSIVGLVEIELFKVQRLQSMRFPAVQKITFVELRARVPSNESKKPPDLRPEVFV
jgi:hypothetical protein